MSSANHYHLCYPVWTCVLLGLPEIFRKFFQLWTHLFCLCAKQKHTIEDHTKDSATRMLSSVNIFRFHVVTDIPDCGLRGKVDVLIVLVWIKNLSYAHGDRPPCEPKSALYSLRPFICCPCCRVKIHKGDPDIAEIHPIKTRIQAHTKI